MYIERKPHHLRGDETDETLGAETFKLFKRTVGQEAEIDSHLNLLKMCKNENFFQNITKIVKQQFLRKEIVL